MLDSRSQAMLLRESVRALADPNHGVLLLTVGVFVLQMGIGADASQKAFYSSDINAFLTRTPNEIPRHFYEANLSENTNHVLVAVDPAGGGASAFAISSVVQLPNGSVVVRGQFPSFSSLHISPSITHIVTNDSGVWHECFTNRGTTKGSTRCAMSSANAPPSFCAKWCRSSGSWCNA